MSFFPSFSPSIWLLLITAGACIGLAKGGLAGMGMIPILLFAQVFPVRESTGQLLSCLIIGDVTAVIAFRQTADWQQLRRLAWPALIGVVIGWATLHYVTSDGLKPILGWIILSLALLQLCKNRIGSWIETEFHAPPFAWAMGGLGGWSTMLANAAGPVMNLFFLAVKLPKLAMVGTSAWFFLVINLVKVPFSMNLGLINSSSLGLAICLSPFIVLSVFLGRWILHFISQRIFELIVIVFALIGAVRLIWF